MAKIRLPKSILGKETLKSLPAKEKEEYLNNLLNQILVLNPNGVTISQINDATGFTYSTIWHHLEILSCTAQGYKISRGNLDIYYPHGKIKHLIEYKNKDVTYEISEVENNEGKFVCIHEKRQNRLGNHSICKGILLPVTLADDIIKSIKKIKG